MIQNLHAEHQIQNDCLSEYEVEKIREGLKNKWNEINHEYQKLTHVQVFDPFGLRVRKENYEKQLAEIEADIKKLNKNYVFVE